MKRVKISVVTTLLLITLSLTLLSGCSVNLEKINEKNAEAIALGFYTQPLEDFLQGFDDEEYRKEIGEQLKGCDYMLSLRASEELKAKYNYIAVARKNKHTTKYPNGEELKKNKIYVRIFRIEDATSFIGIGQNTINFLSIAFLSLEQYLDIIEDEEKVLLAFYTETLWEKALQVSDKVVEWNL